MLVAGISVEALTHRAQAAEPAAQVAVSNAAANH
jgi:hypothetical protein